MRIKVLGEVRVEGADGRPVDVGGPKVVGLLALLASRSPDAASADWLIEELWEGAPPRTARDSLRVHVNRLRRALEEAGLDGALPAVGGGYALRPPAGELDLADFEAAARTPEGQDPVAVELALSRWGRPFGGAPDLGALGPARVRLVALHSELRLQPLRAAVAAGRSAAALPGLRAFVAEEPYREDAVELLGRALYALGRPAEALDVVRAAVGRLGEDRGLEPGEALRALEGQILRHAVTGPAADPTRPDSRVRFPSRLEVRARSRFAGRDAELDLLLERWAADPSRPALAVLSGPAGIGKSRLAAELAARVAARGGPVLHGWADRDALPFAAITTMVREALDDAGLRALREGLAELATGAVPVERWRAADPATAQIERWRRFEAVSEWLADVARRGRPLVVLDDLHWADRDSVALIRHVVRRRDPPPLMGLLVVRDPAESTGAMVELFDDLREQDILRVQLGGLGADALGEAVAPWLATLPPGERASVAQVIAARTAGNPFLAVQLAEVMGATGTAGAEQLPLDVRHFLAARLHRLPEAATDALGALAVLGGAATHQDLVTLVGTSTDSMIDALDAAEGAGVLVSTDRPGENQFAHGLLQQFCLDQLTDTRRRRLHQRAVEEVSGLDVIARARHARAAVPFVERATALALTARAAATAAELTAWGEAATLHRAALELADAEADSPLRCDLLIGLGGALVHTDETDGLVVLDEAVAAARELRDPARIVEAVARRFGRALRLDKPIVAALEDALELSAPDEHRLRARALSWLAVHTAETEAGERPLAAARAGVAEARRADDDRLLAEALHSLVLVARVDLDAAARRELIEEARTLARSSGDEDLELALRLAAVVDLLEEGRFGRAAADAAALAEQAARRDRIRYRHYAAVIEATVESSTGDPARAVELVDQARDLGERGGIPDAVGIHGAQMIGFRWHQDRFGEIVELAAGMARAYEDVAIWRCVWLCSLAAAGRRDQAVDLLEELTAKDLDDLPRGMMHLTELGLIADAAARVGDPDACTLLLGHLTPMAGRWFVPGMGLTSFGPVEAALGRLHAARGDLDAARAAHRQALARVEEAGAVLHRPRLEAELARFANGGAAS